MGNKFNKKLKKTQEKKENTINSNFIGEYKVIFLGASGTGAKTNLLNILNGRDFNDSEISTSSISYFVRSIELENNKYIILNLLDTVGQKGFRKLNVLFLKEINCSVLGYAINSKESFDVIKDYWCPKIKELDYCKLPYS